MTQNGAPRLRLSLSLNLSRLVCFVARESVIHQSVGSAFVHVPRPETVIPVTNCSLTHNPNGRITQHVLPPDAGRKGIGM
jgi:hypothetical protein